MKYGVRKAMILAGASGVGKTTIAHHLLRNNECMRFSVSACTRTRRPSEVHGEDYFFLSVHEFKHKIAQHAFIEWEEVYPGSYYGTLKTEVGSLSSAGKLIIFDINVRGGLRLKSYFKKDALAVYVDVPSLAILTKRLKKRNTESLDDITRRVKHVDDERILRTKFDAVLCNGQLSASLQQAQELLDEFLRG